MNYLLPSRRTAWRGRLAANAPFSMEAIRLPDKSSTCRKFKVRGLQMLTKFMFQFGLSI